MTHTLLVLGAGTRAVPALRWAREAGLAAIAVDPDPRARARRLAHEFHTIPLADAEAHVALARRLTREGGLAGVHVTEASRLALAAEVARAGGALPPRRAFERALDPAEAQELWRARGLAVAQAEPGGERHEVSGYFRDGAFVAAGISDRRALLEVGAPCEVALQPTELASDQARAAYHLAERGARALGIEVGPVQATLVRAASGLALVALVPAFTDTVGCTQVAPLAHGKSPLQAWFAHLAQAGGPFDAFDLTPRRAAGWISLASASTGLFAGIDGVARARSLPGVVDLWIEEPGRELSTPSDAALPCGYLWAEAPDRIELERRLRAARAQLEVKVACRQVA